MMLVLPLLLLGAGDTLVERLEQARDRAPNDPEARLELGRAYYLYARKSLDRKDFAAYGSYLGKAMDEAIECVRLDPRSPEPHGFMGLIAIYEGDIDRAFRSFANVRRLAPRAWVSYTNIVETLIYKGTPRLDIEPWVDRAERLGAPSAAVELNLTLVAWRDGHMDGAERHFRRVRRLGPELLQSWNGVRVPKPLETLTELMTYCCESPSCGPYLADACARSQLAVAQREVPAEVARRELMIEMDRRRKLDEIYQQHRELEIEVEKPEQVPPAQP